VHHPRLSILIPAAGASERLGQLKQLVEYRSETLIQNAVNAAQSTRPDEIIIVTGAHAHSIKAAVNNSHVRWVDNPQWSTGMGGSIAMGTAAISKNSTGLMILLSDQWRIQAKNLQALAETWQSNPECIVVAESGGVYMPPVIFPASCFDQLRNLKGRHGARDLFKTQVNLLMPVPIKNAAFDLDTQTHLDQLKKHT
jgi:molybdenum cofactor cytidylyltransferase